MADLSAGQDFSDNVITVQRLHDLVEKSVMSNVKNSDMLTNLRLLNLDNQPAGVEGDLNIKSDGILEAHDGTSWADILTEPITMELTNRSGQEVTPGEPVIAADTHAWSFTIPNEVGGSPAPDSGSANRSLGVSLDTIADAAAGTIQVRGVCSALVASASGASVGDWVIPTNDGTDIYLTVSSTPGAFSDALFGSGSSCFIGVLLEDIAATPGVAASTASVYLWR